MEKQPLKSKHPFIAFGVRLAWVVSLLNFYLQIHHRVSSLPETILRFFSDFSNLTYFLFALCFTILLLKLKSSWAQFFSDPQTLTAIAVYLTLIGMIYISVFGFIRNPIGFHSVIGEITHFVFPLFFLVYWIMSVPKSELQWKNVFPWLIYPLVYGIIILLRGACANYYPYPFMDAHALGYAHVLFNGIGLLMAFLLLSLLLVAIAKRRTRSLRKNG
ncbi:MAG: Pr6Pr family membrane protein [Chitinophagaceae bacterium]